MYFYLQLLRTHLGMLDCAGNIFALVYDSFEEFDGGRKIKEFNGGEDDHMFLCNIEGLFFVTATNFNVMGME